MGTSQSSYIQVPPPPPPPAVGKVESFVKDASVVQVSKLNTNYTIKFPNCSGKEILLNVCQKMFLYKKRELVKQSVVHGC